MDEDKKKKEKEAEEEEKKRQQSWWTRTPTWAKIGAVVALFILIGQLQSSGKPEETFNKVFVVGGLLLVALYLFGRGQKNEQGMLTPEQAEAKVREEVERKIREGQFPKDIAYIVGPNNGLKASDGYGQYYLIQVQMSHAGRPIFKRATVGARNGICTIQDNVGILTGREAIPTIRLGERWLKQMQEFGFDTWIKK